MKISEIKYERPDIDKIKSELKVLFDKFDNAESVEEQLDVYDKFIAISETIHTQESLCYVRFTCDTRDDFYSKEMDKFDELNPVFQGISTEFMARVLKSKFRKELEKTISPIIFRNYEIAMKAFDPIITDDCVEENKLNTEYQKLMTSAKIEFDGGTYNIPQLGKFKESKDREIRRRAFCAQGQWMKENADKLDDIFDRMVKVRDRMAKKMGYESTGVECMMAVFWPTILCVYLMLSFALVGWLWTWILWPVAAIVHYIIEKNLLVDITDREDKQDDKQVGAEEQGISAEHVEVKKEIM